MFYRYALVVPADTKKTAPVSREIYLPAGIIHRVIVKYPPGCHQRVYFAIFCGEHKQFPSTPVTPEPPPAPVPADWYDRYAPPGGDWFCGDNENIDFPEHCENKEGWHWFLKGYSPGANYDHLITVRIGVLKEEEISPFTIVKDLVAVFKRVLGLR